MGAAPIPVEIPEDERENAEQARAIILERIVETNDDLMERYLEDGEISADELRQALREATLAGEVTPVFCGTALKNKGVQRLLDAVVHYLPSPLDVPPISGTNPDTGEAESRPLMMMHRCLHWSSKSSLTRMLVGWLTCAFTLAFWFRVPAC